jgi:hypothetical protein
MATPIPLDQLRSFAAVQRRCILFAASAHSIKALDLRTAMQRALSPIPRIRRARVAP